MSTGAFTHNDYGPYPGWAAVGMAVGSDGIPRIMWNHLSDGQMSLWSVAADGTFTFTNYGPYAGYTATDTSKFTDYLMYRPPFR